MVDVESADDQGSDDDDLASQRRARIDIAEYEKEGKPVSNSRNLNYDYN
jgi:hypothetical protein